MRPEFLPWQVESARQWLSRGQNLAHAWLFHGLTGIGKRQYGLALAASLLCEAPRQHLACGQCQACLWVRLGNHPDLMRVRPESQALEEGLYQDPEDLDSSGSGAGRSASSNSGKPSDLIKVEQIRSIEPWYHRTTHRQGWRVVLLYPAQNLMLESANALLKSLEEPPSNTLFLLITDTPDRLLPTILSRCQKVKLETPGTQQATTWLEAQGVKDPYQWLCVAGGAPLKALALSATQASPCPDWLENLIKQLVEQRTPETAGIAEELAKQPSHLWLADLQRLCIDLCLCSAGLNSRYLPGLEPLIRRVAALQSLAGWTALQQWISEQTRLGHHPLNSKLFAQVCLQQIADRTTATSLPSSTQKITT